MKPTPDPVLLAVVDGSRRAPAPSRAALAMELLWARENLRRFLRAHRAPTGTCGRPFKGECVVCDNVRDSLPEEK